MLAAGGVCAAGGIFAWGAVAPGAQLFGPTIRRTGDASTIALTFDDGPNPCDYSRAARFARSSSAAKATFFLIGERVRAFPALAKDIARRGHSIGNHTENHRALTFLPRARIADELARCDEAIETATGQRRERDASAVGISRAAVAEVWIGAARMMLRVMMWSVAAHDWNVQPAERVIRRLRGVGGGDIVLMHDGDHRVPEGDRRHTVAALEYWLPRWKDSGLRFVTLDEMPGRNKAGGKNR